MKPIFGIDITTDKKNAVPNGEEFLVAKPSSTTVESYERSSEDAVNTIERSKLPLLLRIVQTICGFAAVIITLGIVKALDKDLPLSQAYKNAPALFWIAGVCLLVWGILKLISINKEKGVLSSDESTRTLSNLKGYEEAIYSELAVPSNAKNVDVLSFCYKIKNGNIMPCEKALQIARYINFEYKAFADSDNLYLADHEGKYAFPLSSIVSIHTVKKHIQILYWNKEENYNSGIYKQYKLTTDNFGCIHSKRYHIIEINHNGELWGIYIPDYELPQIEELTGFKATEV